MPIAELRTEVLVVGGGLGGVAAALTACHFGHRVVLSEGTDWLGGQLTSQAVPPDEHLWIESRHSSPSYRRLRHGIREYYRRNYTLRASAAADTLLDPAATAPVEIHDEDVYIVTRSHDSHPPPDRGADDDRR